MSILVKLKYFEKTQHSSAYSDVEALFENGGQAPFMECGYYADIDNEPLHFHVGESLAGATTLLYNSNGAEIYKLYVHPTYRHNGLGRAIAHASINYIFEKSWIEDIYISISGNSGGFWQKIAEDYGSRALYAYPNCYFVKPEHSAETAYPELWKLIKGTTEI